MLSNLERSAASVALATDVQRSLFETQSSLLAVRLAAFRHIAHLIEVNLSTQGIAATQRGVAPCASAILSAALTTLSHRTQHGHSFLSSETETKVAAAALSVLNVALLILPSLRRAAIDTDLVPALLTSLERESKECTSSQGFGDELFPGVSISMSCLDVLLSTLIKNPLAFQQLSAHHGVKRIAAVVKLSTSAENLRAHAARFLNLLMSHIIPELVEIAHSSTDLGLSEAMDSAVQSGREEVAAILGREATGMIGRRIALDTSTLKKGGNESKRGVVEAEQQLERLASALSLFVCQSDP